MALSINALITEGLQQFGVANDAAHRARLLSYLNESEQHIAQPGSFLYLLQERTAILSNNASAVALPSGPSIDFAKSMSLRIQGLDGYLRWMPHDRFAASATSSFYQLTEKLPSIWTIARDIAKAMQVMVRPANTSGSNMTLVLTCQMIPSDLVDLTTSFSLLPDGYERTILLGYALARWRQELSRPGWKDRLEEVKAELQAFQDGQRSSKEAATTDGETVSRKQYDEQLAAEA